jgi:hypothetical protein
VVKEPSDQVTCHLPRALLMPEGGGRVSLRKTRLDLSYLALFYFVVFVSFLMLCSKVCVISPF